MKASSILDKLLEGASTLHCRIGPFLALGVKAGLRAIEVLGYDPFRMNVRIFAPRNLNALHLSHGWPSNGIYRGDRPIG